ncbi:MAG TPA: hypothetical protein VLX64_05360 [Thermoplasmata archaeon]|nr:hypothetical protein [Thermoplasmata archaeon]
MAKPPKATARTRHGARKLIENAFASLKPTGPVPTSTIQAKVDDLAGSKVPPHSVYQALRTLVKRKVLSVRRQGRERVYWLAGVAKGTASAALSKARAARRLPRIAKASVVAVAETVRPPVAAAAIQHKLAPGEVVILEVGPTHLEVATNLHGKLVIERQRRPQ